MVKTESDIERDFYGFASQSALGRAVHGKVYRPGMRPADAKTEDVVIKFLAGLDEQVQTGIVIVNVYVPDIPFGANGRMVANKARIAELQSLIRDFIEDGGAGEYWLESDATPTATEVEGISQHAITARIHFKRITI